MATCVPDKVVTLATNMYSDTVHLVTDQSIKNAERGARASEGMQRIKIFSVDQAIPSQWKKYMTHSQNKEELVQLSIFLKLNINNFC